MTIYRRKDSKIYTANFMIKGKRYCFSTGQTTKREARAVEHAEWQRILKNAKLTPEGRGAETLLLDAIDAVYDQRWVHTKDAQRSIRRALNLAAIIGNIQLTEITEARIIYLIKSLEQKGAKASTINRYLTCLKTVLKHHKQPVDAIKLRKEPMGRIRTINIVEEKQIISLLRKEDHRVRHIVADLVEVLLDTGMRVGEALALHYDDIDFNSNLISIWINKGDRPRSVPMTKRVRNILLARQPDSIKKPFPIKAHQVSTAWNWCRKEMGLEGDEQVVPHALRHTCASRMVNAGVDLYLVKEILGHSTIQITERYAHLSPYKLAAAIAVLE